MGVTVCLPLFGNPGQEMEEGSVLKGEHLRNLAAELQERLQKAAATLDRLAGAGWTAQVAMYDALLAHRNVETREEAERHLLALDLDPAEMMIVEDVEEEEDDLF